MIGICARPPVRSGVARSNTWGVGLQRPKYLTSCQRSQYTMVCRLLVGRSRKARGLAGPKVGTSDAAMTRLLLV